MEILSVSLKNFKSHSDRHFIFQPGTNAICGENGAGKTSILEAIAWTLFNYADYSKEDLVRRGAASAQVTVTFVSSADKRTYQVRRCTSSGYEITDPQLKVNLGLKKLKEEIIPWLQEHLGVERNTELPDLLANTVGIPQGTFTADFLKSGEPRKKVFDPILKVEEYKQAFTKAAKLEAYAKAQVTEVERAIAHYSEQLRDWDTLKMQRLALGQEIERDQAELNQREAELAQLQHQKDQLTAQSQQLQQLAAQRSHLQAQAEGKQQTNQLLQQALERAQQAVVVCEENQAHYQAFLAAEKSLQALDQSSKHQQKLLQQRNSYQANLVQSQTQLTKLALQLEGLAQAQTEIEQLQPDIAEQTELEQQQESLTQQLQQLLSCKLEAQTLNKQLAQLQTQLTHQTSEIERIRGLAAVVEQIPGWEQQRDRLQAQLSRIEAAKQFEADLQQIVAQGQQKCDRYQKQAKQALTGLEELQRSLPLLADSVDLARTTIQLGTEINTEIVTDLVRILADLSEQVSPAKLKQQLAEVKLQLEKSYQQQTEFAGLDRLLEQQASLEQDVATAQTRFSQLRAQLEAEPIIQQQKDQITARLKALENPRGRCQIRAQELRQQSQIQAQYVQVQQAQAEIERSLAALEAQLAEFADLPSQIEHQQQQRTQHQTGRDRYLQSLADAERLPQLTAEFEAAIAQLEALTNERETIQATLDQLAQSYDPQQLQAVELAYNQQRTQKDQLAGSLPQKQKFLAQVEAQLLDLEAIAAKRDQAQSDLAKRQRVQQFVTDARQVYNQAGPRITRFYLDEISREADKLFRELINRQNVALEWTGDYEIRVQEGGYWRSFKSLSGGEQMCAALAVRLALLKVLANIDIAFFDEPTTNMDQARRQQLAEAIANIKTFRQLFIISHDDTFESITESLIRVEREAS